MALHTVDVSSSGVEGLRVYGMVVGMRDAPYAIGPRGTGDGDHGGGVPTGVGLVHLFKDASFRFQELMSRTQVIRVYTQFA